MPRRLAPPALLGVLAVGLAGCTGTVAAKDLETAAAVALDRQIGSRPQITCPHDLSARVGAATQCTLRIAGAGATYGVTITVTSVQDGRARFTVRLDGGPHD